MSPKIIKWLIPALLLLHFLLAGIPYLNSNFDYRDHVEWSLYPSSGVTMFHRVPLDPANRQRLLDIRNQGL